MKKRYFGLICIFIIIIDVEYFFTCLYWEFGILFCEWIIYILYFSSSFLWTSVPYWFVWYSGPIFFIYCLFYMLQTFSFPLLSFGSSSWCLMLWVAEISLSTPKCCSVYLSIVWRNDLRTRKKRLCSERIHICPASCHEDASSPGQSYIKYKIRVPLSL